MSARPTALLLARLFTNDHKDGFLAHLGAALILSKFGIIGRFASTLDYFLRAGIGFLIETGIYNIDLTLDSIKEGLKREQFKKDAMTAYKKAMLKAYTEEEKDAIRKEYLKIIGAIGNVGNPK